MDSQREQPLESAQAEGSGQTPGADGAQAISNHEGGRRVERLPGMHLDFRLGNQLFLKFQGADKRYEGKVVGLEPYTYCIVQVRLSQETISRLASDPGVVVQLNAGGTLYGFRSEVVNRVSVPAPLLFLSHPSTIERLVLRRVERVDLTLPGTLHGHFGDHDVMLQDLAPAGCSFAARSNLHSPLRQAKLGDRVALRFDLGCGQPFLTPLVLRRVNEHRGRITMGGQFVDMNDDNTRMLGDYLHRIQGLLGEP